MTTMRLGWSRCPTCGRLINHIEGVMGRPPCPNCDPTPVGPVDTGPVDPVETKVTVSADTGDAEVIPVVEVETGGADPTP